MLIHDRPRYAMFGHVGPDKACLDRSG